MAKVTLQSVADAVGVSRMTVSNAFSRPQKLSADLRARIMAVAEEMGYIGPDPAARALARGRTGTVGLLITGRMSEVSRDAVATEFMVAVADRLADHDLALTLLSAGLGVDREGDHDAVVPSRDVPMDGALVYVCEVDSADLAWLQKRRLPLVTVDQEPLDGFPAVNVDDHFGAAAAAQHLVDLGHRRVGLLSLEPIGPADRFQSPAADRFAGWREALEAAGIEPTVALADYQDLEAIRAAAVGLLSADPRPTGILCFSDVLAVQAIRAAESLGLTVPDDVSVVGFDDSSLAVSVRPTLTTVSQPVSRKGELAVEELIALMATVRERADEQPGSKGAAAPTPTADEPARTVLPTALVVRDSTAPPPQ
ncbi:LacI family DNA-binding transcriptional regulator [Nocardioides acrostichi]|uniref:LacI family DNA-binding transcriptional regulator n=1 Tax=Nocardioides acrostichi TaxID=2784339 RepID=A0A930V512_9ACTN|nr:LacI family DNA-binding transcriptional regulator [Nocardioides acrostichi]MBF4163982.1 LacI family DNA-binding transcriptional regulator [Nocardioides acrostichi]